MQLHRCGVLLCVLYALCAMLCCNMCVCRTVLRGVHVYIIHWLMFSLYPLYPSLKFRRTLSRNCSEPFSGNHWSITFGTRIARDLQLASPSKMSLRQRREYQINHVCRDHIIS
jgi:hypothetical protein